MKLKMAITVECDEGEEITLEGISAKLADMIQRGQFFPIPEDASYYGNTSSGIILSREASNALLNAMWGVSQNAHDGH